MIQWCVSCASNAVGTKLCHRVCYGVIDRHGPLREPVTRIWSHSCSVWEARCAIFEGYPSSSVGTRLWYIISGPLHPQLHTQSFLISKTMSTTQTATQTLPPQGLLVQTRGLDDSICHTQVQAERRKLLASLRGKQLRIPNLKPMYQHWPSNTNADVGRMRRDVEKWLGRSVDYLKS
jgi:hypothetical protein